MCTALRGRVNLLKKNHTKKIECDFCYFCHSYNLVHSPPHQKKGGGGKGKKIMKEKQKKNINPLAKIHTILNTI